MALQPISAETASRAVVSSANWCFWIAGMTGVNTALLLSQSDTSFVIGTVAGQVAAAMAAKAGAVGIGLAIFFNLVIIAYFVAMGIFAKRGHRWAFAVAIVGYGLDTLLLILMPSLMAILFHGWALFSLAGGWIAAGKLREAKAAADTTILAPFPPALPTTAVPAAVATEPPVISPPPVAGIPPAT